MGKQQGRIRQMLRDKPLKEVKHYSKKTSAVVLSVMGVLFCALAAVGIVLIYRHQTAFREWIGEHYVLGSLAVILICAVQVVVALIPGEIVEILSGYVFGAWMGSLLCMIGVTLGSVAVIVLTRRFGRRFVEVFYPREKIDSLPILRDPAKRNVFTFFLFLLPGTPKDLLTYMIGLTEMPIPTYLLLATFARFPSVISSTMGGGALGESKLSLALWVFLITAVASGLGYGVYWLFGKKHKKKETPLDENNRM